MNPLKGCSPCKGKYRLKPVTPGYQDAALTEVKTTNAVKVLRCARRLTGGGSFVPSHKGSDGNSILNSDGVNRELKVMVEKVSDWVSQDGVLEEELLRNIASTVNINVEPNVLCRLEDAHNNVAVVQAFSSVTNQSRMKQATERAASCSSTSKRKKDEGNPLVQYWLERRGGWFKAFGLLLRWSKRVQTQQASKQSRLHCGMRANVSLVDHLRTLLMCWSIKITALYPLWMSFQTFWAVYIQPVAPENTRFVIKLKLHEMINETADCQSQCDYSLP